MELSREAQAIELMQKMRITAIPIQGNEWFVFVGPEDRNGWESPEAVLKFLEAGNFNGCGAAHGTDFVSLVFEAAQKAIDKRAQEKASAQLNEEAPEQPNRNNVTPLH